MSYNLSNREIEVLQLAALGFTNLEIAKQLFISPHTVKAHLESIFQKLGSQNRVQAIVKAITSDLINAKDFIKQ